MLNGEELLDKSTNIIYEKIPDNKFPVTILHITLRKDDPAIESPKHYHRSLEFIIPFNATTQIWANGEDYLVPPYHVGLINSNAIHETKLYQCGEYYKGIVVQIRYDFLKKVYPDYDNIYFSYDINSIINEELLKLFLALDKEYQRNIESQNIAINGYLYLIVSVLLKHQKRTKGIHISDHTDKNLKELMDVISYIDDNYSKELDVDDISDCFGFSYGYLARIFKKQFNMTMKQYITLVRLNHCAYDLLHTNKTSTEIALNNGFPNIKSFNHEFQMKYHMSPNTYRKRVRK